ncbi:Pyridoxal-dependent decarboxylase domain-containing protein 1 [Borealophlyctis nickersoniae]|nr:Pyridoxal-dependent decarboxylase domain-containing protein 1 [Borealophlyctis nickersoniae]
MNAAAPDSPVIRTPKFKSILPVDLESSSLAQRDIAPTMEPTFTEPPVNEAQPNDQPFLTPGHAAEKSQLADPFQALILDILSSSDTLIAPFTSRHMQGGNPTAAQSILSNVTSLVSKYVVDESKKGVEVPAQAHLFSLLVQLTAVLNNPALVSADKRMAVEIELEPAAAQWLRELFGFDETTCVVYHNKGRTFDSRVLRAGLLKCLNLTNVPTYSNAEVLPIIYLPDDLNSRALEAELGRAWAQVGAALGLPSAKLRRIPSVANGEGMDLGSLERMIERDFNDKNNKPCMVIGRIGTPVTGESDGTANLRTLCDHYNMWLHLEGPLLSASMVPGQPGHATLSETDAARIADSCTIDLASWFGLDAIPNVTFLLKTNDIAYPSPLDEESLADPSGMTDEQCSAYIVNASMNSNNSWVLRRNSVTSKSPVLSGTSKRPAPLSATLPVWVTMQIVDSQALKDLVMHTFDMVRTFKLKLSEVPYMFVKDTNDEPRHFALVRFAPHASNTLGLVDEKELGAAEEFWLYRLAQRGTKYVYMHLHGAEMTNLGIDLVCVAGKFFIRYNPLSSAASPENHANLLFSTIARISDLAERLQSCLDVVGHVEPLVAKFRELTFYGNDNIEALKMNSSTEPDEDGKGTDNEQREEKVETTKVNEEEAEEFWWGLGAVRYVPPYIDVNAGPIAPRVLEDIDGLNARIADELAAEYGSSLFSKGRVIDTGSVDMVEHETQDDAEQAGESTEEREIGKNPVCIRIGLHERPYSENLVERLLELVKKKGNQLEKDEQFVSRIAEVIRKGIEEAEQQLRNESSEEVSLLRALPIVGSVLSWWRPEGPKMREPMAKTFSISSGFTKIPLGPNSPRASISSVGRLSFALPTPTRESLPSTPIREMFAPLSRSPTGDGNDVPGRSEEGALPSSGVQNDAVVADDAVKPSSAETEAEKAETTAEQEEQEAPNK